MENRTRNEGASGKSRVGAARKEPTSPRQVRAGALQQTLDRLQRDVEVSGNVDMAEQFRNMKQELMEISREVYSTAFVKLESNIFLLQAADSSRGRKRDLDMLEEGLANIVSFGIKSPLILWSISACESGIVINGRGRTESTENEG